MTLAMILGTCLPGLTVFAENAQANTAIEQTPGDFKNVLPENVIKLMPDMTANQAAENSAKPNADPIPVTGPFESAHPYAYAEVDPIWIYTAANPAAKYINVTFSANTYTTWGIDCIIIYDGNDNYVEYTGNQLAGKTISVIGNSFVLELYTEDERDITDYGFAVTAIAERTDLTMSGIFGYENLSWSFNVDTGLLSIGGTGAMDLFYSPMTEGTNLPWRNFDVKAITIGNGVTSIGSNEFVGFPHLTAVTIGTGVKSIGMMAFAGCRALTSVAIPDSVTSIGQAAFTGCIALATVTIGSGLATMGANVFNNTAWLAAQEDGVVYAGNVAYGYKQAVKDDMPTALVLNAGTKGIAAGAFAGQENWATISIPDSVFSIGQEAFEGTAWLDAQPEGVVYAGKVAYTYKQIPVDTAAQNDEPANITITLLAGTKGIAAGAFAGLTNLISIVLPAGLMMIGDSAFVYCIGLTSVSIPDSVTTIGWTVFSYCVNLYSVSIGIGVNTIGYIPFAYCEDLEQISVAAANPYFMSLDGVLLNKTGTSLIQYPCGKPGEYVIPAGVERICAGAFATGTMTAITIPDSVTSIGYSAFAACFVLQSVTAGTGVAFIQAGAFSQCLRLSAVYFFGNAPSMGYNVFDYNGYGAFEELVIYYAVGTTGFSSPVWYLGFTCKSFDLNSVKIKCDNEILDETFGKKLQLFDFYRKISLQLDYDSSAYNGRIVKAEWTSSNNNVKIDKETGKITNKGIGARSSNITVKVTDSNGIVLMDTVKVYFYKFDWQVNGLKK